MPGGKSLIKAGAGKCRIGYPEGFFPYRGFGPRYLTGEHDDLCVRAAMITNDTDGVLFVSVDTGDLSDAWLPEISQLSGLPEESIFLTATHTHSAPYIDRTIPENVKDADKTEPYIAEFRKALASAVTKARESLVPARIGYGSGSCIANVNRDVQLADGTWSQGVNLHAPSDHTVAIIKLTDMEDNLIALVTNYAIHSSVMLFSNVYEGGMLASGDVAGTAMNYVEKHTGAVSLFTMGAAGDQGPLFSAVERINNPDGTHEFIDEGEAGFALVRALGNLLGREVVRAADVITGMKDATALSSTVSHILVPGQKKPERHPGDPIPEGFEYEDDEPRDLRLSLISIDDIAVAGVPGEIVGSIGTDIRIGLLDKGYANTIVMTQCNGSNSYMGDDKAYDQRRFCGMASYVKKGIAGLLKEGFSNLADKL